MKSAIFWAVVRQWYTSLHGFDVMKVTSIDNQLAYGSYKNGVTRIRLSDIKAKYDTEEKAKEALIGIKSIYEEFEYQLKDCRDKLKLIERCRNNKIDDMLKEE